PLVDRRRQFVVLCQLPLDALLVIFGRAGVRSLAAFLRNYTPGRNVRSLLRPPLVEGLTFALFIDGVAEPFATGPGVWGVVAGVDRDLCVSRLVIDALHYKSVSIVISI